MHMFRQEVVNYKTQRLQGAVIATQPTPLYVTCLSTFLVFLVIVLFLSQSQFSRKETVKGFVIPSKGVVKVFANRIGVVDSLYVAEGQFVNEGDKLVTIKNSQSLATGIELSAALSEQLQVQADVFRSELESIKLLFKKEKENYDTQITQLEKALEVIESTLETNKKILNIKKHLLEKNEQLFKNGYLSESQLNDFKQTYFGALESHNQIKRERISRAIELSSLKAKKHTMPETQALREADIRRRISEIEARLTELDSQFVFTQKAPESGVVTAIQPYMGTKVATDSPILSIIPTDSPLEVELLLPTKSAGFVQANEEVRIRFDAFPYQKFGSVSGKIIRIDKSIILPTEKALPIAVDEAMYRVRAFISTQSISAYGKEFPIKVGMSVEADIILDTRSLLDWLLDPIYAIRGKLG